MLKALMKTIPAGFKSPDDEFFRKANTELFPQFKKLGAITSTEYDEEEDTSVGLAETAKSNVEIYCNIPGCLLIFESVAAYQSHFNSAHRYHCAECRRTLPTAHLLDLHLSETHDSYFAARVERGEAMYACYLEECKQTMLTQEIRKEHCISVHKLPANFRFDQLSAKTVNAAAKKIVEQKQNTDEQKLDVKDNTTHLKKVKAFSFGHPKERTFQKKSRKRVVVGESFKDMHELKASLDEIL